MPLNSESNNYKNLLRLLKGEYRSLTGFDSDSNWIKFHKCLEELRLLSPEFPDSTNRDNVIFFARLRLELPRTSVPLKTAFTYYLQQKKFTDALNGRRLTGQEIMIHLASQDIQISKPTRTNWFRLVGGYRAKAEYLPEEVLKVLYRASVYKLSKERENRKNKLGD